ncbi:MAG: phosphoglycerate kinase, partial [Coriobacteriaceae bacterium]|nr:phosphoglycerate kinase [Coriobacteriaceae bacterium]
MPAIRTIEQADVAGKRVLCRCDFNVPLKDGVVTDDLRIQAALPTIKYLLDHDAKLILMSHLGRPEGTGYEEKFSLKPVAEHLGKLLGKNVVMASDTIGDDAKAKAAALGNGEVLLLENVRFDKREKKNDPSFTSELAKLGDVYVNDAFGAAHRKHASTAGLADYLPAYAGYLMEREIATLKGMLDEPKHPFVAILGGSKVSDKIGVIESLMQKADTILVGGGMCFTFFLAQGLEIGTSLKEEDHIETA